MAAVCYTVSSNLVSSTNQYFPCGGGNSSGATGASAQACCYGEDSCMEDSICRYTRAGVVNGTGYYMAGCTDPTWKDPACPKACTSEYTSDVIYNRAQSDWNCCDSRKGYLNCQEPSDFAVHAPPPQELSTVLQLASPLPSVTHTSSVGSITPLNPIPTSSAPAASSSPASRASSSHQGSSNTSNTGTIAGAAVGAILGIALIAGGIFFYCRRRKTKHRRFSLFPGETDSTYSRRNTLHSTIAPTFATSHRLSSSTTPTTYAPSTRAPSVYTTLDKNNRLTIVSSHYTESVLSSPGFPPQEPVPPLPAGADGMQVVKQLPVPPTDLLHSSEKYAYVDVYENERELNHEIGPFEVIGDTGSTYEMRLRPKSAQELVGTMVEVAELEGDVKRLSAIVREIEAEEATDGRRTEGDDEEGIVRDAEIMKVTKVESARASAAAQSVEETTQQSVAPVSPLPGKERVTSGLSIGLSAQDEHLSVVESEAVSSVQGGGPSDDGRPSNESKGNSSKLDLRRADSTTLGGPR